MIYQFAYDDFLATILPGFRFYTNDLPLFIWGFFWQQYSWKKKPSRQTTTPLHEKRGSNSSPQNLTFHVKKTRVSHPLRKILPRSRPNAYSPKQRIRRHHSQPIGTARANYPPHPTQHGGGGFAPASPPGQPWAPRNLPRFGGSARLPSLSLFSMKSIDYF